MAESATLQAAAFTANGTARERVTLPPMPFDGTVNVPVMHQVVKAYLANQRQGTAATKTRGLVTGGNQKPWRQKGTGRARQGSTRAPHWPGGGTVFGPHGDRNYREKVPRGLRALARKSALNARAHTGAVLLVDRFGYEKPKTAMLRAVLERIGVADRKVLILTDGAKPAVYLSARNLPNVHVSPYGDVTTYHLLWSDVVVIESSAIGTAMEPMAERDVVLKPARKRAPGRADKAAGGAEGEADAAPVGKRPAKKAASKKPAGKPAGKAATRKPAAKGPARAAAKADKTAASKSPARKAAAKKSPARKAAPKKKGGK